MVGQTSKVEACAQKTVVITGASRRLGLYLCEKFIADGWAVVAISRKTSKELAALSCEDIEFIEIGDYQEKNIRVACEHIRQHYPRVSVLIHNASVFGKDLASDEFDISHYQQLFELHMAVPAQLNLGLKSLLFNEESPGCIVHITDIFAENPNPAYALYCSTKAGMESLSKSFAKKYAPGIRVNSIQPGPIQFLPAHSKEQKQKVLSETLLSFEGGFLPMFQAVTSLIDNSYITGAALKVDGGRSLGRG